MIINDGDDAHYSEAAPAVAWVYNIKTTATMHIMNNRSDLKFGLSTEILDELRQVFSRFPAIDRVLIYGSRARGDFRPGSDIDLMVLAPTMASPEFAQLWMALDDLPIIFRLDVSLCQEVDHPKLMRNMLADGVTLYQGAGLKMAT